MLAKTDATLHDAPNGDVQRALQPFQPIYVYGRRDDGWIEVGRGIASGPEGWMQGDRAVDWKQNIVVSLANPAGRKRQLMFESEAALLDVVRHEASISMARELRRKALEGGPGAAEGVVSIEPAEHVDITRNFYLFPILDWKIEEHPMTFELMRVLKLASLTLDDAAQPQEPESPRTAGLVFVIDTTRSMQPYIDAARDAVRDIVARIRETKAGKRTRFAVIGFRDSVEAAPGGSIGYRTETFVDLTADQTLDAVLAGFARVEQADASTRGYSEDAASGVWAALNMPGWENAGYDGGPIRQRYVIIVSDASPKQPGDVTLPAAIRDLDAASIREKAQTHDITLMAVHLKTPDGVANHRAAAKAYGEMTRSPRTGLSNYYPVELVNDVDPRAALRPVIDGISRFIAADAERETQELLDAQAERELTPLEEASLAMRLTWLGRERNATADPLIEAWAIDQSLENPLIPALETRLLVTKNEISTMSDVLREIVAIGERTQGEMREGEFFELLQGALARIARNPEALVNADYETLDEAVGEFLGDLPYRSPILGDITPDSWINMGPQRRVVLDRVRSRLQLYEHFHDDDTLWTALYEGAPDGEKVFAMPFEALP
jgi:hypothetical protein